MAQEARQPVRELEPDENRPRADPLGGRVTRNVVVTYAVIEAVVLAWVVIKYLYR